MKYLITLLVTFTINSVISQTSNFHGTWKWVNGNETFYIYVNSKTDSDGYKSLRIDYKMEETINDVSTELYSSKINNQYFWAGAFLSDYGINAKGDIKDCTHNFTTDCYDGRISLEFIPASGGMNSQPKIHWILSEARGMVGYETNNRPTSFNVPTNIILTKEN
jgi:hypothetical protein